MPRFSLLDPLAEKMSDPEKSWTLHIEIIEYLHAKI